MNDAHFFMVAEDHMQKNVMYFIKSLKIFGGLEKFYISLMIPKGQKITNKYINKYCDLIYYENHLNLNPKWSIANRYFLESKSESCFMVDADILVVGNIADISKKIKLEKKLYGALAYKNPFDKSYWNSLFEEFNLNLPKEQKTHIENNCFCPSCYFNYGFVGLHKDLMLKLAPYIQKYIEKINNKKINHYKGQVALCLAIFDSGVAYEYLDYRYNFATHFSKKILENYEETINDLRIVHYCREKNIINKDDITIKKVKECIKKCHFLKLL
jgi:hypothetical protein